MDRLLSQWKEWLLLLPALPLNCCVAVASEFKAAGSSQGVWVFLSKGTIELHLSPRKVAL